MSLSARSLGQTSYWKNSETLWNHTLAVTSDNDVAHNNLGFVFLRRGELDKAILEFQAALDIRSRSTQTHYSLGAALIQNNMGNAFARKQLWDEAVDHLQEAARLRPDYADAYFNLGSVRFQQGRIDEAIAQWQKALAIRPTDAEAHRNVASALRKQGNVKGAIAEYEQALNIAPEDSVALNNLAWILATSSDASTRDGARSVTLAVKAVEASGGKDPNFVRTLAAARAEAGQFAEAVAIAETAKALASTQDKPELASRLEEEIARLPRSCRASRMTETHLSSNGTLSRLLMIGQTEVVKSKLILQCLGQSGVALDVRGFQRMLGRLFSLRKLARFGVGCSQNPQNGRVLVAPGTCGVGALSQLHSLGSVSQSGIGRCREQPCQVA